MNRDSRYVGTYLTLYPHAWLWLCIDIPSYKEYYVDHSTRMWLSFPPGTGEPSYSLNRTKLYIYFAVLRIRIWDSGAGAFLTPGSGMGKNQDQDPG